MNIYKQNNVFEEALERIRMIYQYHDDVIVSMSGGKDSSVLFELTVMVAREMNRLPVKVFWLDQEAEWQHTVDYMDWVMRRDDVTPLWFQVPFVFPNNLSTKSESILIWDEAEKDKWIHPRSDISIHESPIDTSNQDRDKAFYTLIRELPGCYADSDKTAVLVGMRIVESLNRRMAIGHSKAYFRGETWCQKKKGNTQIFWPIYDFTNDDIWTALGRNHWKYNEVYDLFYRWGVSKDRMRVSALIHETAYHNMAMLQEMEPETYKRFVARVPGTSTVNHVLTDSEMVPRQLPIAFRDWKEYRDYLLVKLIDPSLWDHFRTEWIGQDDEEWYKTHVREVIIGDTCGTINSNKRSTVRHKIKGGMTGGVNKYNQKDLADFERWNQSYGN